MKRILAFILIFIMIMSSVACTKKKDEPDDAVIVDNDITDDIQTEKPEKEERSEDKTEPPAPEDEKTNEDDKTVIPDNSENEEVTENPTQTPEKEPDEQQENKPEDKPEEQPKEEPVIYDDSNATPASSFEYSLRKDGQSVLIKNFIGNEEDVVIPNYIDGYPVKIIGIAAFSNTQARSVVIPENIEEVYPNAFSGSNIKTATVKSKSVLFWTAAFEKCNTLESITFSADDITLQNIIFYGCSNLKDIIFLCDAPQVEEVHYLFPDHKNATVKYKKGTEGWDNIQNMLDEGNRDDTLAEIE